MHDHLASACLMVGLVLSEAIANLSALRAPLRSPEASKDSPNRNLKPVLVGSESTASRHAEEAFT